MSRRSGVPRREMPVFWVMIGLAALLAAIAYFGAALLIPAVAGALAAWIAYRLLPEDKRALVPTLAVEAGVLALTLPISIASGLFIPIGAASMLIAILATAWLIWRPGMAPLLVLGGINWFSVLSDYFLLVGGLTAGSAPWRQVIFGMVLRVAVIIASYICYRQIQRRKDAALMASRRKKARG